MDATAEELIARLRRNPDDDAAFAALRAHYHRLGDYASLANLMEGWAGRARDPASSAQAFFETGELVLGTLRDRARSAGLYERALERNPLLGDAAARLEALYEEAQDWRRLGEWLERRADALDAAGTDPRMRAAMRHRIGELWEQRFQRPDRAILHYRKAFELDPTLVAAIYAAREIYRAAGNLKAAATLYDLEANAEADGARKLALLRELAHLRAERLTDIEGAIVALRRALGLVPGDLGVMHDLATVLLRRAERAGDAQTGAEDRFRASDLLFQMAQSVPPDAALGYLEAALDATPDHDGAVQMLERVASQTGREDLLPIRWVAFLQAAPDAPGALEMRRRLGHAYVDAGQLEDAIVCFEPLLEAGDASAAETLVELYRQAGREGDVPRALTIAVHGLPPQKRVPRLREIVDILVSRGDREQAAARTRDILAIDPADPEALAFLEDDCRSRGDFGALRDLLLGAARVPGLSVEARKQRLREVASVSENKLGDVDGAISAWRATATLDPADAEARSALKRLLERAERWDDLVQVLEREALSITDPEAKAEVYKRLAKLHREKRRDSQAAIQALTDLLDLRPGDRESRDDLCDGLLEIGRHTEALPMLRERIESSSGAKRVDLLRTLAKTLEEHLRDDEGAFETSARLLDEDPGNLDALDRMERIDMRTQRFSRLLETLSYRLDVATEQDKPAILGRMGAIAERDLGDLERAAEFYVRVLDLAPEDVETLDSLCSVYDRAERYRDLVVLLRTRAGRTPSDRDKAELYRRIARILGDRVRNEDGAAEAWQEVLRAGEDEEALRQLAALAEKRDEPDTLEDLLRRLGEVVAADEERRDILVKRASLLADRLDRKTDAIGVLRDVLSRLDATFQPALAKLALLCDETGDNAGLADALERQLALTSDDGLRVPLASRLADLYEQQLADTEHAIEACFAWSAADTEDAEPRRRLVRLLEKVERWTELLDALDALAMLEPDDDVVGSLVLRSSEVAQRRMGDVDGAWARLAPRVMLGDARCEEALRELARFSGRGEALAELYVALAQQGAGTSEEARHWATASRVYEEFLSDPAGALEATLRAFATDLDDDSYLDEADRLAALADGWTRLGQVYEALIRRTDDPARRVSLLVRHGEHLADQGGDPSAGLDRLLRACSLAPQDDLVLERAAGLAERAGRSDEMLIVYDRRRASADNDARRVDSLLRAASLCDLTIHDRDRAMHYIAQAVALTVRSPELADDVETTVREMDDAGQDPRAARGALVGIYQKLAEDAVDHPEAGAQMLLRAAKILDADLGDSRGAFDALKQATAFAPTWRQALDELETFAEREHQLEELDRHYAHLIDEALDSKTAAELLRRRGALLEDELQRYSQAAEVYSQLLSIASTDPDAPRRLRACLRQAGRHQDLLMAIDRELELTHDTTRRVALLKEAAKTWETSLRNRWEALDAWKKVLTLVPDDADARAAVDRIAQAQRAGDADPFSESDVAAMNDEEGRPLAESFPEEQSDPDFQQQLEAPGRRRGRRGPTKVVEEAEIERSEDDALDALLGGDAAFEPRPVEIAPAPFDDGEQTVDSGDHALGDLLGRLGAPESYGTVEAALEASAEGLEDHPTTDPPLDDDSIETAAPPRLASWDSGEATAPVEPVGEAPTGEIDLADVESIEAGELSSELAQDSFEAPAAEEDLVEELEGFEEVLDTGDLAAPPPRTSVAPPPPPPRPSQPGSRLAPPPPPAGASSGTPSRPPPPPPPAGGKRR